MSKTSLGNIIKTVANWTRCGMECNKLPFEDAFKYAITAGAPEAFEADRDSWLSQFPKSGKDSLKSQVCEMLKKDGKLSDNAVLLIDVMVLGNRIVKYLQENLLEGEAEPEYSNIEFDDVVAGVSEQKPIIKGALWRLVEYDLVYTRYWDKLGMTTIHLTPSGWKYRPIPGTATKTSKEKKAENPVKPLDMCCKLNTGEPDP